MRALNKWIAISFNLPANPSRIRVYFWRKLKELGAVYLRQGLAVLPNTPEHHKQLLSVGGKMRQSGGEAVLIELSFTTPEDEAAIARQFDTQLATKYAQLFKEGQNILGALTPDRKADAKQKKEVTKLVKQYDHLGTPGQSYADSVKELEKGLALLIETLKESTGLFRAEAKEALDLERD